MSKIRANVTAMPVTTAEPTTPTTKITEELLLCRLCSLKYRADGRRPIALRCVHTFCELCLEKLLRDQADSNDATKQRRNKRQQLVCPTCQAVTPLGKGSSPSSLPVNPSIMELLGILGRPASDGQQHRRQVGSNENAAGYSPVTIIRTSHGQGSGANDQVGPEQKNTMAALIQSKKDRRNGFDLVNHLSRADGNTDEGGGGKGNSANLVSTVNVVASAAQQQQQQQQQPHQQCGQSFSAAKTSSVPTAMTSAVSSVSTVKTSQQQSCSASTSDTNARPTSTAPGGGVASQAAHRCCRCGLRPATVSVASSSQTMAPQKLCSDCWNQPAKRIRDDDDQKRGLESAADAGQSARTTNGAKQQPETICVTASGRLSTAKTDGRSGVSSSVTLTPQTARNSHGASKKSDDSSSVARDRPAAAGLVDNTTSTIEVRRRPTYVDKRARTAPSSSTQDNDQSPTVGTDGTGAAVDQPVQSTTVQPPDASYSSVPRQPSTVTMQQRSSSVGTSSETQQRSAVPDTMSEASRGSNAATSRSTNHAGERDSSSFQCSAPTIADIHPLPCSNPPYNPDFNEVDDAGWSSAQQRHRGASNAPTGAGPNRYPPETPIHEKHRQKEQEQRDISAPTGTGVALSFLLTNTRHQYPADQPPKYEDIIRENEPLPATAPEAAAAGPTTTQAVLPTPNEPVVASGGPAAAAAAVKLVRSFGKYGEISTQPGAFRAPCSISVTAAVREVTLTRIVVGDSANGTAQVFGDAGECLSMLRADAVRGCCLINDNKKLLLGTDRGVEVSRTLCDVFFSLTRPRRLCFALAFV